MAEVAAAVRCIKDLYDLRVQKMLNVVLHDAIIMHVTHGEAMRKKELDTALAGRM